MPASVTSTFRHTPLSRLTRFTPWLLAGSLLTGCFGDSDTDTVAYSQQVVFGDSLSDSGSYAVGAIAAAGGGKFTVNSLPASSQVWAERVAAGLSLAAPCPAQTGLEGDPAKGLSAPVTDHPGCTNYAQGGSRVTDPVGPHNKAVEPELGYLTVPVASQISRHLQRTNGRFSGQEIVFVFAGGNDLLWQTDAMTAEVAASLGQQIATDIASGACIPADETGSNCFPGAIDHAVARLAPAHQAAMEQAGRELAALVNQQIAGKGAKRVVVLNLPDVSKSPSMKGRSAVVQAAAAGMVTAFNNQLAAGLNADSASASTVLQIDVFGLFATWAANPSGYGFSNFADTACDLTKPVPNLLGSSITCNTGNVVAGDVSRYTFADTVHPTPYTHGLMADHVLAKLRERGWR